jgi:membrane protein implicated in regulation of membrane protease activity
MEWLFWVWIAIGIVFAGIEAFVGGYFALSIAVAAGLTAILTYLGLPLIWQLVAFGGITALLFGAAHQAGKLMAARPLEPLAGNRLVGKTGLVIEEISEDGTRGIVRVDREEWRADGVHNAKIREGIRVEVVAVEGAHLVVRPLLPESSDAAPPEETDLSDPQP